MTLKQFANRYSKEQLIAIADVIETYMMNGFIAHGKVNKDWYRMFNYYERAICEK